MRIATSTMYSTAVATMNQQEQAVFNAQQQVSTGKRILSPADDPVGAAKAVQLNQDITRNTDFASNRTAAESTLNAVGTALSSVTTLLTNVKATLVQAGDGSLDATQKGALAQQLAGQMQELQGYANAQDGNGEYLFAGWQVHTQPYVLGNYATAAASLGNPSSASITVGSLAQPLTAANAATIAVTQVPATPGGTDFTYTVNGGAPQTASYTPAGTAASSTHFTVNGVTLSMNGQPAVGDNFNLAPAPVLYQGDSGARPVEINDGREMSTTLTGSQIFDSVPTGNGTFATTAASTNTGSGIVDQGSVLDPSATSYYPYTVKFSVPGVAAPAAANTGGATLAASTSPGSFAGSDTYTLTFGAGNTYNVTDTTTGASISTGNTFTPGTPITVNGANFDVTGTPAAGDAFALKAGPNTTYSVTSPNTPAGVTLPTNQTYTSGQAIKVLGINLSVSGAPAGGDSFTVARSSNTSIFGIMQSAIDALSHSGNGAAGAAQFTNQINAANAGIDNALTQVDLNQSTVGGRLNELSALDNSSAQIKITLQAQLASVTDVDFTAAVSTLTQAQTALTAAQKSFSQVANLSLFNYIQ